MAELPNAALQNVRFPAPSIVADTRTIPNEQALEENDDHPFIRSATHVWRRRLGRVGPEGEPPALGTQAEPGRGIKKSRFREGDPPELSRGSGGTARPPLAAKHHKVPGQRQPLARRPPANARRSLHKAVDRQQQCDDGKQHQFRTGRPSPNLDPRDHHQIGREADHRPHHRKIKHRPQVTIAHPARPWRAGQRSAPTGKAPQNHAPAIRLQR